MTATAILRELESLGTEQNRTIYRRHGIVGDVFGVSYANLGRLKKRIKVDHDLALELWASGNHDARVLATMIADPRRFDETLIDGWVTDLNNPTIADAFADLILRTPYARAKADGWTASEDEWCARAGWHLLARLAGERSELPDAYFEAYLETIPDTIHERKNRVREAMNNALIAIGVRNSRLEGMALDVASAIGAVSIDHGETNCKTPDAATYIRRTLDRRRAKPQVAATA
jgi:3-methyladenine DNA glycosylase AlkD